MKILRIASLGSNYNGIYIKKSVTKLSMEIANFNLSTSFTVSN